MTSAPATSEHGRHRPWRSKLLRLFLGSCAVFVTAALIYDELGRADLDRALAEARADGGPVTLAEMEAAREFWPDEANGANVILRLSSRLAVIQNEAQEDSLPIVGTGRPYRTSKLLGLRWDESITRAVERRLQEWADELAQIDRLRDFEGGRFPVMTSQYPFYSSLPRSLTRTSSNLKSLQIVNRAMHGQTDVLYEDLEVLLRHGQLLADEPTLLSGSQRRCCDALVFITIEDVLEQTTVPADILVRVDRLLDIIADAEYLAPEFRGERGVFLTAAQSMGINASAAHPYSTKLPGLRGWVFRDRARGIRMYNRLIAIAAHLAEARKVAETVDCEVADLPCWSVTRTLYPGALEREVELAQRCRAQVRCAHVALAVELYRIDNGSFPESLETVVPKYLVKIPEDPYDGNLLQYRLTPDYACIYSVGFDLTDDGGQLDSPPPDTMGLDFGFRLLPPEKRGLAPVTLPAQTAIEQKVP